MTSSGPDQLRRAYPSDVAAIRALVAAAYTGPAHATPPRPLLADYVRAVVAHQVWVIEQVRELCALLELVPTRDSLLIENITVHPRHQGRDLGRQLLAFAEAEARWQGRRELHARVDAQFPATIEFNTRHGFRETRRERVAGGELVYMEKKLG